MKQGLITLLVISVFVNYIDRGNLSVSAAVMGQLSPAFFWTYSLWQVPAGWLIQRNDVRRVFAVGFLLLGIGETGAAPSLRTQFKFLAGVSHACS